MSATVEFKPDWFSSPGDTIQDILVEKGILKNELADKMELDHLTLDEVISGKRQIDLEMAESFAQFLGSTRDFWLKREAQYRVALENVENARWMESIPYRSMAKDGWVPKTRAFDEKLKNCFDFFKVDSARSWYQKFDDVLVSAAFRTSRSFDSKLEPTIAWIQKGTIVAGETKNVWSRKELQNEVQNIRRLTLESDPQAFLPQLKNILEACGVLFALVKCPQGCAASGATFFSGKNPVLLMSARYLSEDHFWFTLFHEIGHLLMHVKEGELYIEGQCQDSPEEDEANEFSQSVIIPEEYFEEFKTLNAREWKKIPRFARKIGISSGLVVGQMQFYEFVKRDHLNKLKAKYKWSQELSSLVVK